MDQSFFVELDDILDDKSEKLLRIGRMLILERQGRLRIPDEFFHKDVVFESQWYWGVYSSLLRSHQVFVFPLRPGKNNLSPVLLQEGIAGIFSDIIIHLVKISILKIVNLDDNSLCSLFGDEDVAFLPYGQGADKVVKYVPALQLEEVPICKFVKHALDSFEPFLVG